MTYEPPRRSSGSIEHQRIKLPWPKDRLFRILAIDGGGICGILPAAYLRELEGRFLNGNSIGSYFDMIAGTSTGGVIALGLACRMNAGDILKLYTERGEAIFPPGNAVTRALRKCRHVLRYIYDEKSLETELRKIFGDRVFGAAGTRLVIPAFEGRYGEPWIYKTPHHPDYSKDQHEQMARVAMATAAAPTYFKAFENNHYMFVDGGIWANNPIMNAVVDALSCFDLDRRQIEVLSLGCGETVRRVDAKLSVAGLWGWRGVIKAAIRAQSRNALGQAYLLLGKDHVVRVDAPESDKPIELDDVRRARKELPALARALADANGHDVRRRFLADPAAPYSPVFSSTFAAVLQSV